MDTNNIGRVVWARAKKQRTGRSIEHPSSELAKQLSKRITEC